MELEPAAAKEVASDETFAPEAAFAVEAEALELAWLGVPVACLSIRDSEFPTVVAGSRTLGVEAALTAIAPAAIACEPELVWGGVVLLEPNAKDAKAALLKLVESSGRPVGVSVCPAAASPPSARFDMIPLNFASASLSCDDADELDA